MKKRDDHQEEEFEPKVRPREEERVFIDIPKDVLKSLRQIAVRRDMSPQGLLKFYIGQGLREDITRTFGDRVMETTEQVLTKHLQSEEAVNSIIRDIRRQVVS